MSDFLLRGSRSKQNSKQLGERPEEIHGVEGPLTDPAGAVKCLRSDLVGFRDIHDIIV